MLRSTRARTRFTQLVHPYSVLFSSGAAQAVSLQLLLPLFSILLLLIGIFMLLRWRSLKVLRREALARGGGSGPGGVNDWMHGKYASGAEDYTFQEDILPRLMPDCCEQSCARETCDTRLWCLFTGLGFIAAICLIPIAIWTRDNGADTTNVDGLGTAGWTLLGASIFALIGLCCFRAMRRRNHPEIQPIAVIQPGVFLHPGHPMAYQQQMNQPFLPQYQQQQQQQPAANLNAYYQHGYAQPQPPQAYQAFAQPPPAQQAGTTQDVHATHYRG
jgi:hypothetical protein